MCQTTIDCSSSWKQNQMMESQGNGKERETSHGLRHLSLAMLNYKSPHIWQMMFSEGQILLFILENLSTILLLNQ